MSATPPQPTPSSSPSAPDSPRRPAAEGSILETLESILIAFVLAFVFRAFIVEAFVIPTGSMAPTLLGQHVQVTCPQCGFSFPVGPRDYLRTEGEDMRTPSPIQGVQRGLDRPLIVRCPMCEFPARFSSLPTSAGDRILVLKYLYAFPKLHDPQRWDVVVFKNPEDPEINYIKRLVGLPGEQLWIVGGNIYTRPLTPDDQPIPSAPWTIQRKPDRVQRAVWQPIYHSDYYPLDKGESPQRPQVWTDPWQPRQKEGWSFDAQSRRWNWSGAGKQRVSTLDFDYDHHQAYAGHVYFYNEFAHEGAMYGRESVQDLRLAATVEPAEQGGGATLEFSTAYLLIRGVVSPDGKAWIETAPAEQQGSPIINWTRRSEPIAAAMNSGAPTRIELWHVDQAVSLWINGEKVARWDYNLEKDLGLSLDAVSKDPPYTAHPMARVVLEGPAAVHSVDLDRDLYYTQTAQPLALATHDEPATIAHDRFFCLGDNSPESKDGRLWTEVDPWLEHRTKVPQGFVPREMMIGRAFFVYYPAPQRLKAVGMAIVPNFGKMRMIH